MKKIRTKAFTLAEVLITLAVIGIVASITIPSIVASHQKRVLETQFAKTYRTLQTAVNLAIAEHGSIESWNWADNFSLSQRKEFFDKYFLPHLNVARYCFGADSVGSNGCFPENNYYYALNGVLSDQVLESRYYPGAILADGSSLVFHNYNNCITNNIRCAAFYVDVNGRKKPNMIGMDLFTFEFFPQTNEFLPGGVNRSNEYNISTGQHTKSTEEQIIKNCNRETSMGWYCPARIVKDGFKINY